jgi:multisite-specific tRNA:(cytosine-C5)-methyltransferase
MFLFCYFLLFQERQSSKDVSPCTFRLSSEGLPLLLPYITKQILYASAIDFQHLLHYRTIKFPDFVDAKFGEEASNLLPGCCVVVLREGKRLSSLMHNKGELTVKNIYYGS